MGLEPGELGIPQIGPGGGEVEVEFEYCQGDGGGECDGEGDAARH